MEENISSLIEGLVKERDALRQEITYWKSKSKSDSATLSDLQVKVHFLEEDAEAYAKIRAIVAASFDD